MEKKFTISALPFPSLENFFFFVTHSIEREIGKHKKVKLVLFTTAKEVFPLHRADQVVFHDELNVLNFQLVALFFTLFCSQFMCRFEGFLLSFVNMAKIMNYSMLNVINFFSPFFLLVLWMLSCNGNEIFVEKIVDWMEVYYRYWQRFSSFLWSIGCKLCVCGFDAKLLKWNFFFWNGRVIKFVVAGSKKRDEWNRLGGYGSEFRPFYEEMIAVQYMNLFKGMFEIRDCFVFYWLWFFYGHLSLKNLRLRMLVAACEPMYLYLWTNFDLVHA